METCEICNKQFKTQQALMQHKNDKHLKPQLKKQNQHSLTQFSQAQSRKRISKGKIIGVIILILVILGLFYGVYVAFTSSPSEVIGPAGSVHTHQDFKVYINGNALDFTQAKYQKPHENQLVHLEGGDGDVIHVHATGVTIGLFFKSINCCIVSGGN